MNLNLFLTLSIYRTTLAVHIRKDHQDVQSWKCSKCYKCFKNHPTLFTHNFLCHFEGEFKCAADGCDFKATSRADVIHHYDQTHPRIICRLSPSDLYPLDGISDEDLLGFPTSESSSLSSRLDSSSSLSHTSQINLEESTLFQVTINTGPTFESVAHTSPVYERRVRNVYFTD